MTRRVAWVVLCEDEQHYAFAYRFLKTQVPELRDCRKVLGPGHQGVRARLGTEVLAIRKQGGRSGLLAIIDADVHSVLDRRNYALGLCKDEEAPRPSDPVAVLLPRRNIETWIAWLDGTSVNETTRYTKLRRERDCQPAVEKLRIHCEAETMPAGAPDSLKDACAEFRRVRSIITGRT